MEGFTLIMALVDAVPVLCFGCSMILIALRFHSIWFALGACISTLAGCGKVLWKLILGVSGKNVTWLNRWFVPVQVTGFGLILVSLFAGKIDVPAVLGAVESFPAVLFYALWGLGMGTMLWYRKVRFDNSARANWTAQTINCAAQAALLIALLLE